MHRSIHPERSILSRAEERLPAAPHRRACCVLNLLFPIHFARRVSRHAGTQCLRAIFNCASFRWEWWQIPTKARSCSTSPLGGAGAALSLSSQPTRVLYRRRELARGRRSQHMRCARKFSRRMTILQLKAGRHGIYMCILHAILAYIYMQEGTRKRRKRRGEEMREAGGGHDSREIKTKAREVAWWWWWWCCSCCWWWVRFFFFFCVVISHKGE